MKYGAKIGRVLSPRDGIEMTISRRTATQKTLSRSLRCGRGRRRFRTTSCWRRTRFSHSRARRVRKSRASTPNQSRNRLNMAVSYNKPPRERVSYVADSLERKHFGEAQVNHRDGEFSGWMLEDDVLREIQLAALLGVSRRSSNGKSFAQKHRNPASEAHRGCAALPTWILGHHAKD